MKKRNGVILLAINVLLCACSKEEPKTVQFYLDHQEEREQTIAKCKDKAVNPVGETIQAQNCRAAHKAVESKFFEHKPISKDKTYKSF